MALAEHLALQSAELAGLLFARVSCAALLLSGRLDRLGLALDGLDRDHLGLLGVLARNLDSSLGALEVLGAQLLKVQVVVLGHPLNEHTVTLANQGIAGLSEHRGSHLLFGWFGRLWKDPGERTTRFLSRCSG